MKINQKKHLWTVAGILLFIGIAATDQANAEKVSKLLSLSCTFSFWEKPLKDNNKPEANNNVFLY
ncbi:hypothetical protein [Pedobacter cryoconitis]|uniref:hypothetical protein n=1 Tax=Pedobacter cryoconitis TaxID=188932 RepID=UPI000DB9F0E9|nr:hypothetical protein [Pedobacter cryoconitis]